MGPPQKGGNRHPNPRGGKGRTCPRPGGQDPGSHKPQRAVLSHWRDGQGGRDDRRSGRDQQTDGRGGGKEKPERDGQTKRQTNKELDRQRDRRPGTGRQAREADRTVSRAGHTRTAPAVCPSVRVSAGWRLSGSLGRCAHGLRDPQSPTVCGPSSPFGLGPSS